MAWGVGRPYWAVVAAAAIFQSTLALTWRRARNRVFGNVVGLALFAALPPITRTGPLAPFVADVVDARYRLATAVAQLREAAEIASGEWWQRALPGERIAAAEQESLRMLTLLSRQTTAACFPE
ncbi:FUSC family protein [Streptomyces sp. NPDC003480]